MNNILHKIREELDVEKYMNCNKIKSIVISDSFYECLIKDLVHIPDEEDATIYDLPVRVVSDLEEHYQLLKFDISELINDG